MEFNLSDETLDHLRFFLEESRTRYTQRATSAKRSTDIVRHQARVEELNDLLAIFDEPVEPAQASDVTATNHGTVFHIALHNESALAYVREQFNVADYQWLGTRAFAVDHRFAPQVVCILRDGGFNVEVK